MPSPLFPSKHCSALIALLAACHANAQSIDVKWGSDQRYARTVQVAPTKPAEFCKAISGGQKLHWSFEAAQPMSYAVYEMDGSRKVPLGAAATGWKSAGDVGKSTDARYCWTWTNSSKNPVELAFNVKLAPPP